MQSLLGGKNMRRNFLATLKLITFKQKFAFIIQYQTNSYRLVTTHLAVPQWPKQRTLDVAVQDDQEDVLVTVVHMPIIESIFRQLYHRQQPVAQELVEMRKRAHLHKWIVLQVELWLVGVETCFIDLQFLEVIRVRELRVRQIRRPRVHGLYEF